MKFLLFKKHFLILSMLKTVVLLNMKSVIRFSEFLDEYKVIKSNQITFIVTSPQHKCLGEWNSYERAPDSAKKQNNNLHMDSIYLQTTEDNVQNTHTYTQYTQCTIKTYFVTNTPIHIIHRIYMSALCPHLCIVICEGARDYNLQ